MTAGEREHRWAARVTLALAQGLGSGRVPFAPGTVGSVVGIAWFAVLLVAAHLSLWGALAIHAASVLGAVRICHAAELLLGREDPGSVVLDEIVALPTCFVGSVVAITLQVGSLPALHYFFAPGTVWLTVGIFLAFRFFDVAKPWPVRGSQSLPRGWGVVVDDQLAAVYVNLVVLAVQWATARWPAALAD